jgi:hypothetical protein
MTINGMAAWPESCAQERVGGACESSGAGEVQRPGQIEVPNLDPPAGSERKRADRVAQRLVVRTPSTLDHEHGDEQRPRGGTATQQAVGHGVRRVVSDRWFHASEDEAMSSKRCPSSVWK